MVKELKTGDLVLCKVGSFPPWPAVVFPQRLLRNDVYRKRRPNCVAVCFFNDPTYYWEQPHKLRPFEPKTTETFLQQEATSTSQKDLIEAYKQARSFSSLNDFIVDRLKEEDRFGELKEELNKVTILPGEDPFMSKAEAKKRTSMQTSTRSRNRRSIKSENEGQGDKNINDTQFSVVEHNDNVDESKTSSNKKRKKSKLDRSRRVEISLLIRRRLQRNLVQRDTPPSEQEALESYKLLDKISQNLVCDPPFFDIDALRESKLHKLLKVIVNNPELNEFHYICKDILVYWADLISQLKAEKLANDQKQQQQQQHQQQPQNHAPTETPMIS